MTPQQFLEACESTFKLEPLADGVYTHTDHSEARLISARELHELFDKLDRRMPTQFVDLEKFNPITAGVVEAEYYRSNRVVLKRITLGSFQCWDVACK